MKAQELRIGNWVQGKVSLPPYEGVKLLHQVNSMMIRDCEHYKDDWSCEPILLTPEILEKCGFYHHHDTPHPNRVFRKNFSEGYFELEEIISFFYGGTFCCVQVDYLHQLQNIIYALTGEELEFKP